MCDKPLRAKDRALLERISEGERGNIWRSPLLEAMKRAGARAHTDEYHRLHVVFGCHSLHISRLDLAKAEDFQTPFKLQLQAMTRDLLMHIPR
jgi:hypothetical protein